MNKIIDNCCSPEYLKVLMEYAINSVKWNMRYPLDEGYDNKIFKLDIIQNGMILMPSILAGLSIGLFAQIYGLGGNEFFMPGIQSCVISIKDKHTPNNLHTDEGGFIKITGVLNNDWEEKWGGGFIHGRKSNYIEPTSFCVFNPSELHSTAEILTDKKLFTIEYITPIEHHHPHADINPDITSMPNS